MVKQFILAVIVVIALISVSAQAQQLPVPRLLWLQPAGAQRGTEVEVEFGGDQLEEPRALYFSHPGIRAEKLAPENDKDKRARFKVMIEAGVPVGDHDVRLISEKGASNPRTFVIGDVAEMLEAEPNNEPDKATKIDLERVINGRTDGGEDVDWFVFEAKKGQRLIIECRAWRIDSRLDASLWLHDAAGKLLATSHDESVRDEKRDPMIDIDVPADGQYTLKLADFTYAGGKEYFYRLRIGTRPYIDFVMPLAVAPGVETEVACYGRNLPGGEPTDLKIGGRPLQKLMHKVKAPGMEGPPLALGEVIRPSATRLDGLSVRLESPVGSSNARLLMLSELREQLEVEPNDTVEKATRLEVPCAVSGWFEVGDLDHYVFATKKDATYHIEVYAERLASPADPDLELLDPKGNVRKNQADDNDNIGKIRFDTRNRDLRLDYKAPADEEVTLRIEHLYRAVQGGPHFIYRLVIRETLAPDFRLVVAPEHAIHVDSHVLYRGGRERLDVLAFRNDDFNGPITVTAKNLPEGVSADPIVLGPEVKWGTLILTANADAPMTESAIEIVGTAEVDGKPVERRARGGVVVWDTVNTPAISRMTRSIVVSVRDAVPYRLTAEPAHVEVEEGQSVMLKIHADRRADMTNKIQLNAGDYDLPNGMKMPNGEIAAGGNDGQIEITTEKMKPGTYSFSVSGDGQVPLADNKGNIRCVYPTNPVTVVIKAKPEKTAEK